MGRFNQGSPPYNKKNPVYPGTPAGRVQSAIGNRKPVTPPSDMRTHQGGAGWSRDPKSELFLLAVSFMGGDSNFYEKDQARYRRLISLVETVARVERDIEWLYNFIHYLRNTAQMRTVALVVGIEAAKARARNGYTDPWPKYQEARVSNRDLVSIAMSRADEPAEAIAYWYATTDRSLLPQWLKSGIGDAATRLYTEKSYLKYKQAKGAHVGMADVIRLVHPKPKAPWQGSLFRYISWVDGDDGELSRASSQEGRRLLSNLPVIDGQREFKQIPRGMRTRWLRDTREKDSTLIGDIGVTWEQMSEWYPNGMDKDAWEAMIPHMGYMALLRNLSNFDKAGISRKWVEFVANKLSDPDEVAKSRQLPFRFYSAYRATDSVRWDSALDSALTDSLRNIPQLDGGTLVLVDRSGSMFDNLISPKSQITYADIASLFGSSWKLNDPAQVDLYQYGSEFQPEWVGQYSRIGDENTRYDSDRWIGVTKKVDISRGGSVLPAMGKFRNMGGTKTHTAIAETWRPGKHKRLILITDEQSWYAPNYDDLPVSPGVQVYTWNLGGYKAGTTYSGKYNRHSFGGLTDDAFKLIPILEAGNSTGWPWEH